MTAESKKADLAALRQETNRKRGAFAKALKELETAGGRYIDRASRVPQDLVKDCRFFTDRLEMLPHLPKDGVVAEVGTDRGAFAARILTACNPRELHVFELDLSRIDPKNLEEHVRSGRCIVHPGDSSSNLAATEDDMFDWIYIDGDHSYEGVRRDLLAAQSKVKPGGLLVFNDYCVWSISSMRQCGVARAVNEFCNREKWPFVFFAFQSSGYFDLAIRRP